MKTFIILVLLGLTAMIYAQDSLNFSGITIDRTGKAHPWSHLNINNDTGNLKFAIVTDCTGGYRSGVFDEAVRKLNLLQPDFVISIGDLIEGYTREKEEIYMQWSKFRELVHYLEVPFFYLPGNHDYTNNVMAQLWEELFGSSYYYFIYKNVLFLCLNSEEALNGDETGMVGKRQFEYAKTVLNENNDVRWTFVFIHQPLWLYDTTGYWNEIESLLATRKHSVFAGHLHHYTKYERNNGEYYVLATTGGISELRGPDFGEFDHIAWITMTDEGPVMANLLLDGIWADDVMTEELTEMINSPKISAKPVFVDESQSLRANFEIKITNDYNYPMWTYLSLEDNQFLKPEILRYQKEIGPGSTEIFNLPVNSVKSVDPGNIDPLIMNGWFFYKYKDNRDIQASSKYNLVPVKKEYCHFARGKIWVDGNLDDWEGLSFKVDAKSPKTGNIKEYSGDYDGSFEFDVRYDYQNLYIAMSVWDDEVIQNEIGSFLIQDVVRFYVDSRPVNISSNGRGQNQFEDYLFVCLTPSTDKKANVNIYKREKLPEDAVFVTRKTLAGFDVEISIPITYLESSNGAEWENFRFNTSFMDYDENGSITNIWWKPEWSSEKNYIGSGMFFKSSE